MQKLFLTVVLLGLCPLLMGKEVVQVQSAPRLWFSSEPVGDHMTCQKVYRWHGRPVAKGCRFYDAIHDEWHLLNEPQAVQRMFWFRNQIQLNRRIEQLSKPALIA